MKPDWKDAPDWARYLAQDESGDWFWYREWPEFDWENKIWDVRPVFQAAGRSEPISWMKSLEERPRK